jgi:hypothetical protein
MSIRTILAAAAIVASASIPAIANDNVGAPNRAIGFFTSPQTQPIVEGRNSDRVVVQPNRARAAEAQGFFPVDTDAAQHGARSGR